MIKNCICSKRGKTICVGHQKVPIKKRSHEMGFIGQEIWLELVKHRFVGKEHHLYYELTPREQRIKNWLIWGRWSKDR